MQYKEKENWEQESECIIENAIFNNNDDACKASIIIATFSLSSALILVGVNGHNLISLILSSVVIGLGFIKSNHSLKIAQSNKWKGYAASKIKRLLDSSMLIIYVSTILKSYNVIYVDFLSASTIVKLTLPISIVFILTCSFFVIKNYNPLKK